MSALVITPEMASAMLRLVALIGLATLAVALWPASLRWLGRHVTQIVPALRTRSPFDRLTLSIARLLDPQDPPIEERRERSSKDRRALGITALVATAVAAVQFWWIWTHRQATTLDFDEARYVAGAIKIRQGLTFDDPGGLELFFGPVTPVVSALGMLIGPLDVRTAVSSRLILFIALAISITGVGLHLTTRRAAIFAGIAVAILPVTLVASHAYLLVGSAALAFTAATWALLSSNHGNNWRIWLVGICLLGAPLSRGMTLSLLPGFALAVLYYTSVSPRGFRRSLASLSVAAIVLAGFFLTTGHKIVNYVVGGLTNDAASGQGIFSRLGDRWAQVSDGMGSPLLAVGIALAVVSTIQRRRGKLAGVGSRRETTAVGIITIVGGSAFLIGDFNGAYGLWDYPLIPLLVVFLVGLAVPLLRGRSSALLATATLLWLAYLGGVVSWLLPHDAPFVQRAIGRYSIARIEARPLEPRYAPERRSQQGRASDEWWEATVEIDRRIQDVDAASEGPLEVFHVPSSSHFVHEWTWILAAAEGREPPRFFHIEIGPEDPLELVLESKEPPAVRVLMISELGPRCRPVVGCDRTEEEYNRAATFPQYVVGRQIAEVAEANGWRVVATVPLPYGDQMEFYGPPDVRA